MNSLKKVGYYSLSAVMTLEQTLAAEGDSLFGGTKVQTNIKGSEDSADVTVQNLVSNVMLFLGIVAVLYGIYGGFLILTAGGAEEKVKQGRTILIQVAIGLVVIFLANSIVQFILDKILTTN